MITNKLHLYPVERQWKKEFSFSPTLLCNGSWTWLTTVYSVYAQTLSGNKFSYYINKQEFIQLRLNGSVYHDGTFTDEYYEKCWTGWPSVN